ncbi:MAG: pyruvate dehydrogenase complex dihydrolipoamide acetyltransferase [bacterium]
MATLICMPEVAANATQVTLQTWIKKEGEIVAVGDCLAEIETDKAIVEFNADRAGVMGPTLIQAGQEVEVGSPIGVLLDVGETGVNVSALLAKTVDNARVPLLPNPSTSESAVPPTLLSGSKVTPSHRVFVSPLARRLAKQRGIDLNTLIGTGPNGRIVKRDIEAVSAVVVSSPVMAQPSTVSPSTLGDYNEVPHSGMRRTIARRLTESKSTIPHFYLSVDCRMDRLMSLRSDINTAMPRKISVNDFIVRAVAVALSEVPQANVSWTENAMRQYTQADIAVAVSTDFGLITPIVRAADRKSLSMISQEIADLAARARASQLRPDEYQGGSFSVSNLGMFGVSEFSAIINPPQAAILAVGVTQQVPVVEDGAVKIASVMRCTLSVDHRAIDGALAAHWLAAFKRLLENPLLMLI